MVIPSRLKSPGRLSNTEIRIGSIADVSAVAKRYARYQERCNDLEAGHALAASSSEDPDMKAMADEEIQSASLEMAELEVELQRMLLPKDPDDARPAYLEIRAGTGGDESALFAGDLLRMYTRYAEQQGWKVELMSESPTQDQLLQTLKSTATYAPENLPKTGAPLPLEIGLSAQLIRIEPDYGTVSSTAVLRSGSGFTQLTERTFDWDYRSFKDQNINFQP